MPRKILHLDLDAFFCAVEEQRDPSLQGKPFAVGGRPEDRGVVASCSYAARAFGVRSAMPMSRAVRICPDLLIVSHHFPDYREMSRRVMACLHDLTPLVEQISIDEAFLDVTALPDSAEELARRRQAIINQTLSLSCSLGVASNKLVAKIANNIGKASARRPGLPPNAIQVVPTGEEAAFLAPLPVEELWGVGPKTAERLHDLGLMTIGDLAQQPETELARRFGKTGYELAQRARGIDDRPIVIERETKSVSRETTFTHDMRSTEKLKEVLRELCESLCRQLEIEALSGCTVKIKLRWSDFTTLTRQITLDKPTRAEPEIYAAAAQLLDKARPDARPVRLIGVGVSGFEEHESASPHQPSLWDTLS